MGTDSITIPVPFVQVLAKLPESADVAIALLRDIKRQYGATITAASLISNVPEEILYAVIYKESRGRAALKNPTSTATGLMQIRPATANGYIVQENLAGKLTPAEKMVLRRFLGARLDCILSQKWGGDTKPRCMKGKSFLVTREDLMDPEFNIHVGAIGWSFSLRLHRQQTGLVRLDRAWAHAALGEGTAKKVGGLSIPDTLSAFTRIGWGEYFTNLTGRNSVLDLVIDAGVAERRSVIET